MNEEALKKTIETKEAHYWSRSRKALWHKGKTSGFVQKVIELRIDDDQDALWMSVDIGNGASCHVGYKSCFYRSIPLGPIKKTEEVELEFKEKSKKRILDMVKGASTVVIVSHSFGLMTDICDRVILLHKGKVVHDGAPQDSIKEYYELEGGK